MRELKAPEPQKMQQNARSFLIHLVPALLAACGVAPEQSFYGFRVNIEAEIIKRISRMDDGLARKALELLKKGLEKWE